MRQRGIEKGQRDGKRHRREGGENRRKRRERGKYWRERERLRDTHTHRGTVSYGEGDKNNRQDQKAERTEPIQKLYSATCQPVIYSS